MAISARRRLAHTLSDKHQTELSASAVGEDAQHLPLRTRSSLKPAARRVKRTAGLPFATISMSLGPSGASESKATAADSTAPRRMDRRPQFMIASAAGDRKLPDGVPAWRNAVTNLAAGATAGCAVEAALYPIDTIKTRLQMATHGGGIRALFKAGGGKALYAGVLGNLAGVAPSTAVFMAAYEPIKQAVEKRVPEDKQFLGPLVAGAGSGLVASLIRVPTEVVKQRMQSGEFSGAITALKNITAKEGFRGLYAGYGSFLLRDLPFDAIEFFTYEQLRRTYRTTRLRGSRDINGLETAAIGAAAGAVTGILTTPFDVLKTRLMTQGTSGRYKNVVDCAAKIWREEGAKTFFKGWEPRVIWISIGGCVFFSALEEAKKLFAPRAKLHVP